MFMGAECNGWFMCSCARNMMVGLRVHGHTMCWMVYVFMGTHCDG